jgi:N-acetyl-alpha-D-glucosaminyl L-malate synthase BshA
VDTARFSKKPIEAFRKVIAPHGERVVLHASNFRKIKRISDVIRIFAEIRRAMPAKLLLVGDGPERPMAEDLCRQLELCDDVRMLGKQQDMEDIFAVSDLFLLPSEYESFGLAALEAMAAGVPVVASEVGGLPEIITQGVNGYMGPVGDVDDMGRKAIRILSDDTTLAAFRMEASLQAQRFDISSIVPQYEALYDRCLANARG